MHPYHQPTPLCSKCKGPSHICRDCGTYQCAGCHEWGPGHMTPNCPTTQEAQETWERSEEWARAAESWGMNEKTCQEQWRDTIKTWAGVPVILNEEWMKPRDTSPSPSPFHSPAISSLRLPQPHQQVWQLIIWFLPPLCLDQCQ